MGWTTPRTWVDGELESASIFNPHIRDNLGYLLNRPGQTIKRNNAANYTTTSTTFVDVDTTNLAITVSMSGAVALVCLSAGCITPVNGNVEFDVLVDGVRYGGTDGFGAAGIGTGSTMNIPAVFVIPITGLTPGSHIFKLQWRVTAGTGTLLSNGNFVVFAVAEIA